MWSLNGLFNDFAKTERSREKFRTEVSSFVGIVYIYLNKLIKYECMVFIFAYYDISSSV